MAEFCIDCENRMMGPGWEPIDPSDVYLDWDFCEGCGQWCMCIVSFRYGYRPCRVVHSDRCTGCIRPHGKGIFRRFIRKLFKG